MALLQPPARPQQVDSDATLRQRPLVRVMTRPKWNSNTKWQEVPYLQPLTADDAAAPTKSRATFKYLAGAIKYEDQKSFNLYNPISLREQFVRIDLLRTGFAPLKLWYGRFTDESFSAGGTDNGAYGEETLTAYGLIHELDRTKIHGSFVTNDQTKAFKISASVPFNLEYVRGFTELGNRSGSKLAVPPFTSLVDGGITSAYAFSGQQTASIINSLMTRTGTPWNVGDIVEYLLAFYGSPDVPFTLGGQLDALKAYVLPKVETQGKTIFQILNTIIDRRRGLGWTVIASDAGAEVKIFTTIEVPVTIDGSVVPANNNQSDIDAAKFGNIIDRVETSFDTRLAYGQIIVSGQPLVSCFTVSFQDGNLIPAWTSSEQSDYVGALGSYSQIRDNDAYRNRDELAHVWTTYLIDADHWNWKVGNGEGGQGDGLKNANVPITSTGKLNRTNGAAPALVRTWGHALLRSLPILKTMSRDGSRPEYREPICLIYDQTLRKYVHVHKTLADDAEGHVRALDKDFGIEVSMHPPHLLALGSWLTAASSETQPKYDYRTIIATVAARTDQRLEVTVTVPNATVGRVLNIEVEDAELWYIVDQTVLDVAVSSSGGLVRQKGLQVLRDDSPRLRQIAALAQAWYGKQRSSLRLSVKDIWPQYPSGTLLGTVKDPLSAVPVNTVVSRVAWDLVAMRTTVETSYAELDVKWNNRGAGRLLS